MSEITPRVNQVYTLDEDKIKELKNTAFMQVRWFLEYLYSKTCVKWPLSKRPKVVFQDQLLLDAGQKYCRMLQGEHSAILSTFIKLPFVIKIFVLSGCFTQV